MKMKMKNRSHGYNINRPRQNIVNIKSISLSYHDGYLY